MKCIIFILVFASFVKIYRFSQNLILPSQSSQQINYQGTLNQDQNTGSSEDVIFEGTIYSKRGFCLDNWGRNYGYEMLGFSNCNLLNEGKTQQWKFLSNGQIVQNVTGLCISYYPSWSNLMITNCNNTDQLQFWTHNTTKDSQWMYFTNVGYTKQQGDQQCLVKAGDYAELTDCDSYDQTQLFVFTPPPTIIFQGPIYSISSDLCLDTWDGDEKLAFLKCNGNENQKWIFLSNKLIIQKSSGQCIQYDWNFIVLRDCYIYYFDQIWNYEMTYNQQVQFINQGQTKEAGVSQCMVQDEEFAKLHECNTSQHNQFFSFVPPPPLPPSPPPLNSGSLQSKYSYHCLDILEYNDGYEMLGFTDCVQTNEYQYWQFLQNGQIKQQISGMCISYYPDQYNLMITTCNASDLLQFWTNEACQDNFCTYKNQGYSQLQGQDYCIHQDAEYAELDECDYSYESQLFSFNPDPSPPSPPFNPPFPYDGDDDDYDNDDSDSGNDTIIYTFIIVTPFLILLFVPIFIVIIRGAVSQRGQEQQEQQQEQEQQQIQQQQHLFINTSTTTSQADANSTTRNQLSGNITASRRQVSGNSSSSSNNNNRYNSYGQPSTSRRQQQQGQIATSLISALNQRQNNELQEQLLERRIQDSLISDTFWGASSEVICCICLDELREGDRETILPCAHQFHKKCFDEWLQTQKSRVACPLCNLHLKDTILP